MLSNKFGLSGSNLEIVEGAVRKTSPQASYNPRLMSQLDKQNYFSKLTFTYISTPKVLCKGEAYFDMEYINAHRFDSFLSTATPRNVSLIISGLNEYLSFLISTSRTQNAEAKVKSKLGALKQASGYRKFIEFLQRVDVDLTSIPYGFCHGDLTFANILFNEKKIYFIDFLDTYVDSYLIDLTKLKQDLYYQWSSRVFAAHDMRVYQLKKYIWAQLEYNYYTQLNSKQFQLLDAINLLRIEPYLKNSEHRLILSELIERSDLYKLFLEARN